MSESKNKPLPAPSKKSEPKAKRYKLLAEVTYDGKRPGTGEIVDDIPEAAAAWLLENNYIKEED